MSVSFLHILDAASSTSLVASASIVDASNEDINVQTKSARADLTWNAGSTRRVSGGCKSTAVPFCSEERYLCNEFEHD
jgi:hypothetical protein